MHINTFFKHAFAEKFVHNFRKYNFWFQIELLFPSMYSSFQYNAMHPVGNYLRTMYCIMQLLHKEPCCVCVHTMVGSLCRADSG